MLILLILQTVLAQKFDYHVHVIPHPDKVAKGGEDAYLATHQVLAVADGVGGWNNQGVDPSKYSRQLVEKHQLHLEDPFQLLAVASNLTNHILGSSTLVVMRIFPNLTLKVANMGDCAYTIIRDGQVIHQSQEQQHSFNYPFQLGPQGDDPKHAQQFEHQLQLNDIVVVGSDGIYDNLSDTQILKLINTHGYDSNIAKIIAEKAFQLSLKPKYDSPFAKRAREQEVGFYGGKSDDITIIVSKVIHINPIEDL